MIFNAKFRKLCVFAIIAIMAPTLPAGAATLTTNNAIIAAPNSGAVIPNFGTIEISPPAANSFVSSDALTICAAGSNSCVTETHDYPSKPENACWRGINNPELLFELPLQDDRAGSLKWATPSTFEYSLNFGGDYRIWYTRIVRDNSLEWPSDPCSRIQAEIFVKVAVPRLEATSEKFVADSQGVALNFKNNVFGCDFGTNSGTLVSGQKVVCTYRVDASRRATGTVPVTYFSEVNGGSPKEIGKAIAVINETTSSTFTVPTNSIRKIAFGIQVTPLPGTYSTFPKMDSEKAISSNSAYLNMKVKISGPSRVVRGVPFRLTMRSQPSFTGACLITSYPEASGWGDLGNANFKNGVASKTVTLLWPKRLGDGFTVGLSVKCSVGKYKSFDTYGAMGYFAN